MQQFKKVLFILISIGLLSSCASTMHNLHKIQRNKRHLATEQRNFTGEKALTQWWYFDCFMDDGSTLVLLFVPHQWWKVEANDPGDRSLLYISYLKPNGDVIKIQKVLNSDEVSYEENAVKCKYLEILKSNDKEKRNYTINLLLDELKGTAKINSEMKAFSPLPAGSMGKFGTRYLIKKGKQKSYRYSAHIPEGKIKCDLDVEGEKLNLSGTSYHEQGWFTGDPNDMGEGWVWFHFASDKINLFGAKSFFYLEMDGEVLVGGLNSKNDKCDVTDTIFSKEESSYLVGGKLEYRNKKLSFDVVSNGKSNPLICIPAYDTEQLWGTMVQQSSITIDQKGKKRTEQGRLMLETCKMGK